MRFLQLEVLPLHFAFKAGVVTRFYFCCNSSLGKIKRETSMWQNLTFTQIEAVFNKYQNINLGWWAWLSGENNVNNIASLLSLRQFITDNIGREDKKLTNEDKIQLIQILANIKEELYTKPIWFARLYHDLWHNECSPGMREILCVAVSSPQFNWEVLTALQTNSVANPILATQPVAPSERALGFVKHVMNLHLLPQKSLTSLYLRWSITIGELTPDPCDYSKASLLEKLLKVPAPPPFLMDSICGSEDPESATKNYIRKAKALQRLTAAELDEIKKDANPLEAALFLLEIKSHPQLNKPEIREQLRGVTITSELSDALQYAAEHGVTNIRAIIHSAFPLRLAKELRILQNLAVSCEYHEKLISLKKSPEHTRYALYEISGLTKECCELIINAELNDILILAIASISPNLLTPERCKSLALKKAEWFRGFYSAVLPFKNQQAELEKVLDLLIESPHPEQISMGSTALIQAKLFNATGLSLLKTADKVQKITPISSALQGLEAAKLLTDNMVAALFKEVSPQPTPVSEECLSLRATG